MKQGQTIHHPTCECDFCRLGETLNPTRCQATKEHCQYPECDCDRNMKAKREEYLSDKRLAELEEKLAGEYVGGMTEYWERQKSFLLSEKGQEIADVLDGPEQECYPIEVSHHVTDPSHGGKVTCHKCNGFIIAAEGTGYLDHQHRNDFPNVWFHTSCYNPYEHYYGLDKPID